MRRLLYILLVIIASCTHVSQNISNQKSEIERNMIVSVIEGEGICTLTENITINQAKDLALKNAKNDVIQKAETKVTSFTYSYLAEEQGTVSDQFSKLIMEHSQAKILNIVHENIIKEEIGDIQIYHAFIKAKVGIPKDKATEKSFYLEAKLYGITGKHKENFIDGEEALIKLESSQDCFIYVFNIYDEGQKIKMIFPYGDIPIHITGFNQKQLPDKMYYNNKLVLHYEVDKKKPLEEEFFIIATLTEASMMKLFDTIDYEYNDERQLYEVLRQDLSPGEFYRKIFNMKPEEMAWFVLPYKVFPEELN